LGPEGSLTALIGSGFQAGPSQFLLTDGLTIEATDEAAWNLENSPNTIFTFYGGLAAGGCEASNLPGTPAIEIADSDVGDLLDAYLGNFVLPHVIIGPGAHVQLADVVDNGNRGGPVSDDEALYIRRLEFADADGRLMTNGLPLYYKALIGDPSQIVDGAQGDECGDATEDGVITATDALAALQAAIGTRVCLPCVCDVDNSGATTASDALRLLQAAVGQPVELVCVPC
jgi:hypothetical protein